MGACSISKYLVHCNGKQFEKMNSSFSPETSPSSSSSLLNTPASMAHSSDSPLAKRSLNHVYPQIENKNNTKQFNNFIKEMIPVVKSILMKDNTQNPEDILRLQEVSKNESIWISIMIRLIDKICVDDQLGPSVISIFVEETPLPSKEQVMLLLNILKLNDIKYTDKINRNVLVVFSCLSEKIAGTNIADLIVKESVDFVLNCLRYGIYLQNVNDLSTKDKVEKKLDVMIFALIALENFSKSSKSKFIILEKLRKDNPLKFLSSWTKSDDCFKHQIGFISQYLLDNFFTSEEHAYGFTEFDCSNLNVRLNDEDTSENLKISPDGLEARNDALSFESVRSTIQVDDSCWYYEVTLLTNGIMQIGFATKSATFLNDQGFGIGDDQFSVGFDGCRNFIWYNADPYPINLEHTWKQGDVVGLLLDIQEKEVIFYLNGVQISPSHTDMFRKVSKGLFPSASLMSFQHIVFNFGMKPFKYPPNRPFKSFNDYGFLDESKKYVLPKRLKLERLRLTKIDDNACSICCENKSNVIIQPCQHRTFCEECTKRLSNCPICRCSIEKYTIDQ